MLNEEKIKLIETCIRQPDYYDSDKTSGISPILTNVGRKYEKKLQDIWNSLMDNIDCIFDITESSKFDDNYKDFPLILGLKIIEEQKLINSKLGLNLKSSLVIDIPDYHYLKFAISQKLSINDFCELDGNPKGNQQEVILLILEIIYRMFDEKNINFPIRSIINIAPIHYYLITFKRTRNVMKKELVPVLKQVYAQLNGVKYDY